MDKWRAKKMKNKLTIKWNDQTMTKCQLYVKMFWKPSDNINCEKPSKSFVFNKKRQQFFFRKPTWGYVESKHPKYHNENTEWNTKNKRKRQKDTTFQRLGIARWLHETTFKRQKMNKFDYFFWNRGLHILQPSKNDYSWAMTQ